MLTQEQAKTLVTKQDLKESADSIKKVSQNQANKVIKTAVDTRDIAFNAGVQNNLNGVSQKVDAFQIRLDNQTRNMSDVARVNDAMYADLKGISKNLQSNTISNNRVVGVIKGLLIGGIQVSTTEVTRAVIDDLNKVTGHAIGYLIKDAVHDELEQRVKEAKKAKDDAQQAKDVASWQEKQCEKYTVKNEQLVDKVLRCINRGVIEFGAIWLVSVATTGWWRILTIMIVVAVCWAFNKGVDDL